MPLLPYSLIRPFLFSMEPERAHDLSLRLMSCPLLRLAFVQQAVQDPVTVAGLEFPNRIGLAAGLDKNAQCIDAFSTMGFGFAEVGTVTPLPQPGNPQPRMFRLPQAQAIINRMGFNNDGVEAFVRNVQQANFRRQRGRRPSMLLGLNIGKNAATPVEQAGEDYQKALRAVYAHADYVAVNISSPNTRNLRTLQEDKALHGLLASLESCRAGLQQQYGKRVPLFVKIAPDLDDGQLDSIASALLSHDMDGVIATNTTVDRAGVQDLPHGAEEGGLSGAPLRDKSTQVIRQLRVRLGAGFPIIGAGGVMTPQDAVEKISAGADLVQLLTGFVYGGPPLVRRAAQAIAHMCSTAQATPAEASPQS